MNFIDKFITTFLGYSSKEVTLGGSIALIGGGIVAMVGGFDSMVSLLLFVQIADILTGTYCAKKFKMLSSTIGIRGIDRKIGIWILIAFAFQIDKTFGNTGMLRAAAIAWYIAMEGLSLLENLTAMGIEIFQPLRDYLIQLKDGNKKGPSKLTELPPPTDKLEV